MMLGRLLGRTLGRMLWKTPEPTGNAGKFSAALQAIFLLILTLICGALAYVEGSIYWAFTFHRAEAEATIAETVFDKKTSTHKVVFDFVTASGERVRGDRAISFERSQMLKPGGALAVVYDTSHPERHHLAPYSPTPWFAVLLGALALFSLSSTVLEVRRIFPGTGQGLRSQLPSRLENWMGRGIRMVLGGVAAAACLVIATGGAAHDMLSGPEATTAKGTVVSKWTAPSLIGDGTVHHVGYTFATADGREIKQSSVLAKERFDALREGEAVDITYVRTQPTLNTLSSEVAKGGETRLILWALAALALCYVAWQGVGLFRFERSYREAVREIEAIEGAAAKAAAPPTTVTRA